MRGRRPDKLTVAQRDQGALHYIAHSGSLPWFEVQRAKIVLAIASGERPCSVADRLECDAATVWRACQRYRQGGLELLYANGRQGNLGHPQQISPVQRAQIVELACLEPIAKGACLRLAGHELGSSARESRVIGYNNTPGALLALRGAEEGGDPHQPAQGATRMFSLKPRMES